MYMRDQPETLHNIVVLYSREEKTCFSQCHPLNKRWTTRIWSLMMLGETLNYSQGKRALFESRRSATLEVAGFRSNFSVDWSPCAHFVARNVQSWFSMIPFKPDYKDDPSDYVRYWKSLQNASQLVVCPASLPYYGLWDVCGATRQVVGRGITGILANNGVTRNYLFTIV